jgi:quercetin dioxygenase-like cupin family protein
MKVGRIENFVRGWFIGDFEPSILRTKDFEVGLLFHAKGEHHKAHYHALSDEYNVLIEGDMTIQGERYVTGDVFIIHKGVVADPIFHEDCKLIVVKIPSIPSDKFEVE